MGVSAFSVRSNWRKPDYVVMRVTGEIDVATVGRVDAELSELFAGGCRYLVIDLRRTRFCDAAGLSCFVAAQCRVRARQGWLRLVGPQPIVMRLLQLTDMAVEFSIFDTVESATGHDRAASTPARGPVHRSAQHDAPGPRQATGAQRGPAQSGRVQGGPARPGHRGHVGGHQHEPTAPAAGVPRTASRTVRWGEVATRFAEITGTATPDESVRAALQQIVTLAVRTVPGSDGAGLRLASRAGLGPFASANDLGACTEVLQDELGEGPSVQAGAVQSAVYVKDLAGRTGWPRFSSRAAQLGVGSLLCYPLVTGRGLPGALTLYSRRPNAFDAAARDVAEVFASHATVAIAGTLAELQLRRTLRTREMIGQAIGVVMERQGVSSEQAFDLLRRASQASQVRLPHLAHQVVSTTPVLVPANARVEVPDSFADL